MQMHEPPHPGEVIRLLCLEPLGLTVGRAAAGLGVTRKTLSQLLNGHAGISSEMALRLSEAFGGSAESWLQQQAQHDLWRARRNAGDLRVERFHGARQPHDDGPAASARS
ncbi:MAG TPA: HigA family addiction module antitoxin [Thermoanaerobaculia bacterium]|nr:HigA family addiction module antitoxin [Thermoanaerobaculia bacterium]